MDTTIAIFEPLAHILSDVDDLRTTVSNHPSTLGERESIHCKACTKKYRRNAIHHIAYQWNKQYPVVSHYKLEFQPS